MYFGKKKWFKLISALLVCSMLMGTISVCPMEAKAALDASSLFVTETTQTAAADYYSMSNNASGGVDVTYEPDVTDNNVTYYSVMTKNDYNLVDNIIHLDVTDIQGRTGQEDEYSFVVLMGQPGSKSAWVSSMIYVDNCIIMAFDQDGRYKIFDPNVAFNPSAPHESIFAYGQLEQSLKSQNDSLSLDIQVENDTYYITANGETIEFANTNVPINNILSSVKLAFHVWSPINPTTYVQEYLDENGNSLGSHFSGCIPWGVSYTIADFGVTDLASTKGKGFVDDYNNYITYEIANKMSALPLTFEAEIYVPEEVDSDFYGVISGTNSLSGKTGFDVQVGANTLQFSVREGYSETFTTTLYGAGISKGAWTHVAVVIDPVQAEDGQYYAYGYINGELKAKVGFGYKPQLNSDKTAWIAGTPVDPTTLVPKNEVIIGANNIPADPAPIDGETVANSSLHNEWHRSCFVGRIKSVSYWETVRTAEQIAQDYANGVTTTEDGLWGHYVLEEGKTTFEDQSGNGNDAYARQSWIKENELESLGITNPVKGTDYEYSMVVVGDTQIINQTENQSIAENYDDSTMTQIYKWIASKKEEMNIQFVAGVGDITDENEDVAWENTDYAYTTYMLNKGVRFASVLGDHDRSPGYNSMTYLQSDAYKANIVENYWADVAGIEGRMDDTCQVFEVGSIKYLVISLGCGPSDAVLKWADEMCKKYSDHNVIIHTHQYLQYDGTTLDPVNDSGSSLASMSGTGTHTIYEDRNDGEDIWTEVVMPNSNVTIVLSGHVTPNKGVTYSQQVREDGSVVSQLLTNAQNIDGTSTRGATDISLGMPTGMVSILYFNGNGEIVAHRNYSTIQDMYYYDVNQFDNLGNDVIRPIFNLSQSSMLLIPGQTETLTTNMTDVSWSSDNEAVATVDATGLVTGITDGKATITAKSGSLTVECKVWVGTMNGIHTWETSSSVAIKYGDTPVQKTAGGYQVQCTDSTADWHRVGYAGLLDATAGVRVSIDNITTDVDNYSFGIWFGANKTGGAWYDKVGYLLLCKPDGEFVVVPSKENDVAGVGSTVLASGDFGKLDDSLSIHFKYDSDGATLVVTVNGKECKFTPTSQVYGFAVGAMGSFTIDNSSGSGVLKYSGLALESQLTYTIGYIGYASNIDSAPVYPDYTNFFEYCRVNDVAPQKGGMTFAGWYKDAAGKEVVEADVETAEAGVTYYAKFVPKDVISVKGQMKLTNGDTIETVKDTSKVQLRLVTTVDALDYQKVGFKVTNAQGVSKEYIRTTAYNSIKAANEVIQTADFNPSSIRFVTVNLDNITVGDETGRNRDITVQAFWVTHDGVTVYGQARTITIQQGLEALESVIE